MKRIVIFMSLAAAVACGSPSSSPPAPRAEGAGSAPASIAGSADRKYLLERVDDAAIVQLYADGFSRLPLKEKTLIYHLTQAAIAGRDIFDDQRYAHNLA